MNFAVPAPNFSKKGCLQYLVYKFHGEQVLFEQVSVVHIVINFQVRVETWQLEKVTQVISCSQYITMVIKHEATQSGTN